MESGGSASPFIAVLPRAGHHRGDPRAAPAAAAQHGRRGARREVLRGAAALAAQAQPTPRSRRTCSFLTQFLKDFPHLARELFSGLTERQIPATLLNVVQRSLDPQQVVVLVRRTDGEGRQGQDAAPGGGGGLPGRRCGQGRHRGAARHGRDRLRGRVADRGEPAGPAGRDREGAASSRARRCPAWPQPDFIAPLVFDQETLGVIVVSKPSKSGRREGGAAARRADGRPGPAHRRRRSPG